jgi:hypothetical protein
MVVVNIYLRNAASGCIAKGPAGAVWQASLKAPVAPASKPAQDKRAGNPANYSGENLDYWTLRADQ